MSLILPATDRHLIVWTYRQTLMIMDLQIDTYVHGLIDTQLCPWTYRQILMIMDTYWHLLIDGHLWAWT